MELFAKTVNDFSRLHIFEKHLVLRRNVNDLSKCLQTPVISLVLVSLFQSNVNRSEYNPIILDSLIEIFDLQPTTADITTSV